MADSQHKQVRTMRCPKCGGRLRTKKTQPKGTTTKRRRVCVQCGYRVSTVEREMI